MRLWLGELKRTAVVTFSIFLLRLFCAISFQIYSCRIFLGISIFFKSPQCLQPARGTLCMQLVNCYLRTLKAGPLHNIACSHSFNSENNSLLGSYSRRSCRAEHCV